MPAFATSTSTAPKPETAAAIESASATSAASSPERDTRPTSHPRAANAFATAWPIPREAPVTSTRVPGPICTPGTLPASLYDCPMSQDHATVAEEEYLQIIYWLQEAGLPITGANIARAMQVSAPTVHEMIGRLESDGYVTRGPDKRLEFTESGREHASQIVRRHRLIERFLTDVFDIPWDQVHEEAERLEHWMSPVVEGTLARAGDDEIVLEAASSSHSVTRSVAETVSVIADPSPPVRTALPDQLVLGKERYGR